MSLSTLILSLVGVGIGAYFIGLLRAKMKARGNERSLHSRPGYHGGFLALWTSLPAIIVLLIWAAVEPAFIDREVQGSLPLEIQQGPQANIGLTMGVVRSVASGLKVLNREELRAAKTDPQEAQRVLSKHGVIIASAPDPAIMGSAERLNELKSESRLAKTYTAGVLAFLGFVVAFSAFPRACALETASSGWSSPA